MKVSSFDCKKGTAKSTDSQGRPWAMDLDMSAIDCLKLAIDKEFTFQGFAYHENGQFKFYSDRILSQDARRTKTIYDIRISSYNNEYVIAQDSSKTEYIIKKPASMQMYVGSSWKCYGYAANELVIEKARELDSTSGKIVACGYFTCVQDGSQVYATDELGINRRLRFPSVSWHPDRMIAKGLRYIIKFIENADKSINVLDFRQTDTLKTGLSFFTGKVGQNDYRSTKPGGVSLKLEQSFVRDGILFVLTKAFKQYGVVMPGFEETEITDNLELVQIKAGNSHVLINGKKTILSAAPVAIGTDIMVPFEDFSKIFARAHSFDENSGEFSVELYAMPTFAYTEQLKIQVSGVDAKNQTILGFDSHKKPWRVYFWNASNLGSFKTAQVWQINGLVFGGNEFVATSNIVLSEEKSLTAGMEPLKIIMGSVSSVDAAKKTFTMTDTEGNSWNSGTMAATSGFWH